MERKIFIFFFKKSSVIKHLILFLFVTSSFYVYSQKPNSIYGIVKDEQSGEVLKDVSIINLSSKQGTITNSYGFFSLPVTEEDVRLEFRLLGYKPLCLNISLLGDTLIDVFMRVAIDTLPEVKIEAFSTTNTLNQLSSYSINIKTAKQLPVILGETDVIKTLQLFPGIQGGHEGSAGIFVRGGNSDQNYYLIDDVPVYSITHLFGFVSVINEDAVSSLTVLTGGFSPKYNGRLSSVIDIKTKEGNFYKNNGSISIGLLSSKFNINGPIKKGKGSFFISGRRSYFDLLIRPFIKSIADGAVVKLYFYDLNGKINYTFSKSDRVYLSIYNGLDVYGNTKNDESIINGNSYFNNQEESLKWGNFVTSLRWNKLWGKKMFSNLTLSYTKFNYNENKLLESETPSVQKRYKYELNSGIYDISSKLQFDYFPVIGHHVEFGGVFTRHHFNSGIQSEYKYSNENQIINKDTIYGNRSILTNEVNAYIEDAWNIKQKVIVKTGFSFTSYLTAENNYFVIEPRVSIIYQINKRFSLKIAYDKMHQFVHLLNFSTAELPSQLWMPVSKNLLPESSDQVTIGSSYILKEQYDISVEGYYKKMNNLTEFKEGASFFAGNEDIFDMIETGRGWSYGIELMVRKNFGKIKGWFNYSYSKSMRQFETINNGNPFPFKFDRRNTVNIVGQYKLNDKINIGASWVFGTGYPVTMNTANYASWFFAANGGKATPGPFYGINHFPYRNNYRMPVYHHLDVNIDFMKETKYGKRIISAGVYNIYNRLNAFYLKEENGKLYKVSLFPIMPYISLTFKFQ